MTNYYNHIPARFVKKLLASAPKFGCSGNKFCLHGHCMNTAVFEGLPADQHSLPKYEKCFCEPKWYGENCDNVMQVSNPDGTEQTEDISSSVITSLTVIFLMVGVILFILGYIVGKLNQKHHVSKAPVRQSELKEVTSKPNNMQGSVSPALIKKAIRNSVGNHPSAHSRGHSEELVDFKPNSRSDLLAS